MGGSIATAGGLLFIGATNDSRFRAFESRTGKQLWVEKLDTSAHSVPITYLGKDGRQYVAVMAGGGGFFGARPDDTLIAFALPHDSGGAAHQKEIVTWAAAEVPALGAAEQPNSGRSSGTALPDAPGKETVTRMCGGCHTLDVVTSERHDHAGWSRIVQTMAARGATGTSTDIKTVIDYLTAHFGG